MNKETKEISVFDIYLTASSLRTLAGCRSRRRNSSPPEQ